MEIRPEQAAGCDMAAIDPLHFTSRGCIKKVVDLVASIFPRTPGGH